jgi:DNA-binding transcriptional MerR regulator
MPYTIKKAAEMVSLTPHTIRYYDKENLLPFVVRDGAGNRVFTENDMEWLGLICCLKKTGMQIKQIKKYISYCIEGDNTIDIRRQMLKEHREEVLEQINDLKHNLEKIDFKIAHCDSICNVHLPSNVKESV